MAESSLNIAYFELQSDIGVFFGYGAGNNSVINTTDPAWTTQQAAQIDKALKSGLRRFYYPEPIQGETMAYNWSFLKPVATLPFPAGANFQVSPGALVAQVDLPDDFGGFEGKITVVQTGPGTSAPAYIELRNEGQIREMYSFSPQRTGWPQYAAQIMNKGTSTFGSNRCALLIYPVPDMEYVFQFQYYINPDYLSGALPYAYGGPQHAETLREACLAAAETYLDDTAGGVHDSLFLRHLAGSVSRDRRNKPQLLGYNRDRSDWNGWRGDRSGWLIGGIMYDGRQY